MRRRAQRLSRRGRTRRERRQSHGPIATSTHDGRMQMRTGRARRAQPVIGRRGLMKLAAGAGVATIGVAGRGLILPWVDFSRAAAAEELVEPEVRASRDGLLDTTLDLRACMSVPLAGQTAIMSVYEGSVPGPTLRVRPGDTLRINLVNTLDASAARAAGQTARSSAPRMSMVTRVARARDDVRHEPPRARIARLPLRQLGQHLPHRQGWRELPVRVPDPGQPSGRPLLVPPAPARHGRPTKSSAAWRVRSSSRATSTPCPGIAGVPERLLVLQATQLYPDGSVINILDTPPTGPSQQKTYMRLVNGQLNPTMTMRPGETQRWRILNASANVTYRLHLDGHQLHQIAKDGNTLNETWTRDEIVLSPGERVEVLIQAGPAGTYALRTLPICHRLQHPDRRHPGDAGGGWRRRDAAAAADDAAAAGGPLDRRDRLQRRQITFQFDAADQSPRTPSSGSTTRSSMATATTRSSGSIRPRSG